jgi:hypothetical protein
MVINKHIVFQDLHRFWEYAMQESKAHNKSSRQNSNTWSGGLSWNEAKSLALSGWKEGLKEVEKYQAKISPFIAEKVLRHQQVFAISGYNVDVGTYLANDPECFISRVNEERNYPGKIFTIVCSISFSAAIKPETIIQRGAMICALIDAIEYAGHRAEVICNDASCRNDNLEYRNGKYKESGWFEVDVTIKKADKPLELIELAFCLAHPSMLRKIMFSVAEIEGWSDFVTNYGIPATATNKGDIYVQEVFSREVSDEKAIEWVLKELEKLGVDLEIN